MDSSQYKDYILTLLFVKYVSDKFKGVAYGDIDVPDGGGFDDMLALIGNKNIDEEMDICDLEEAGTPVSVASIKYLIATNEEWKTKLHKQTFSDASIAYAIRELQTLLQEGQT